MSNTSNNVTPAMLERVATVRQNDLWKAFNAVPGKTPPSAQDLRVMLGSLVDPQAFFRLDEADMNRLLCDLQHAWDAGEFPEEIDEAIVAASTSFLGHIHRLAAFPALDLGRDMPNRLRDSLVASLVPDVLSSAKYVCILVTSAWRTGHFSHARYAVIGLTELLTADRFRHVPGGGSQWVGKGVMPEQYENTGAIPLYPVLDRITVALAELEARESS